MKKLRKAVMGAMSGILAMVILLGCGKEEPSKVGPESWPEESRGNYEELIQMVRREIDESKNGSVTVKEDYSVALLTCGSYGIPGYLEEDINGDGTKELIFGVTGAEEEKNGSWNSVIYDIYTVSNGETAHAVSGWERNRYYLCEDGMIANEGSNGAADSSYSYYTFDGGKLRLKEAVIYDGMRDEENPWFYFSSGADADKFKPGQAAPISEEQAEEIMGRYVYTRLELTPFESDKT